MDENPLVSVITCTYNRAYLLPRSIKSVRNQTYHNFELLIVDDGSIDNTENVVKSFEDKRIIYHKHETNKGVLAAKNTGLDLATGKYVCTLDDDDELFPEALETAVNKLNELSAQGVRMVQFDCLYAESGTLTGSRICKEGYISYQDILSNKRNGDYYEMVDRSFLGNHRFDERLWGRENLLWIKLCRESPIYYCPIVLKKVHLQHGGEHVSDPTSSLKHMPRIVLTQKVFLEEFGEEIQSLNPKYYGRILADLGWYQLLNGEKVAGRKTLRDSFKCNFLLKMRILHLLSFILNKDQMVSLYIVNFKLFTLRETLASRLTANRKLSLWPPRRAT
jgi:glycosyltransferase involved in cell wall biosynthesis